MKTEKIVKIELVVDDVKEIHFKFKQQLLLKEGKSALTMNLFHGCRHKRAEQIIKSDEGLDPQYSGTGMWGKAVYFATNAKYSNDYAHRFNGDYKELLYCKVIVGNSYECLPKQRLFNPPPGY